jgi:cell division transport system permease protein
VGYYNNLAYYAREALFTLHHKRRLHLSTTLMISVAMLILTAFLLAVFNTRLLLQEIGAQAKVIVFLDDHLQPAERGAIVDELQRFPAAQRIHYVSKEQARDDFIAWFHEGEQILQGLQQNPLPASYVLQLTPHAHDATAVQHLVQRLTRLPGVDEVEYGASWRQRFQTVVHIVAGASLASGVLLSLGVIFIIANTIRLTVYMRLHEIEIMQLVGATERCIKGPFVLLGMGQGCLGALMALGVLFGLYQMFIERLNNTLLMTFGLQQLAFLPWHMSVGVVLGSTLLGYIGSAVILGRSLRALHAAA